MTKLGKIISRIPEEKYRYRDFSKDISSISFSNKTKRYIINSAIGIFKLKNSRVDDNLSKTILKGLKTRDTIDIFTKNLNALGIKDSFIINEYKSVANEIINIRDSKHMMPVEKEIFIDQIIYETKIKENLQSSYKNYLINRRIDGFKDNISKNIKANRDKNVEKVKLRSRIEKSSFQELSDIPFYKKLRENEIFLKKQTRGIWLDDNDMRTLIRNLSKEVNLETIDSVHASVIPSNIANRSLKKYYKADYKAKFLNPLKQFKAKTDEIARAYKNGTNGKLRLKRELISSEWKKFSAVLTKDSDHWVSLNVVPDKIKPNNAYVIYNDSLGNSIPNKLKQDITSVFPHAKFVSSNIRMQIDTYSCGSFAGLNTVGVRSVRNSDIVKVFNNNSNQSNVMSEINSLIKSREQNFDVKKIKSTIGIRNRQGGIGPSI